MPDHTIVYLVFLIFTGGAIFATLSLFARQAIIVGYIFLGMLLGPWGIALVDNASLVQDISQIGIIFLLYLLGLELLPQQLMQILGEALQVTLVSAVIFAGLGYTIGFMFNYSTSESILIGLATIFSSTIIGLKLLPATILHQRHIGQIIISILLIQDIIAIVVLLFLQGYGKGDNLVQDIILQLLAFPTVIFIAWFFQRYVLIKLITRYEAIHEYVFLLAIAWCLSVAEFATFMGLSHEIGAFIAGVSLASSPVALFITEKLKPLRDFFLIIFFFSLGASFNMHLLHELILPATLLAAAVLFIKPKVFEFLLKRRGEKRHISRESGFRLGQISEFSLLIAILALESNLLSESASNMIQLATLMTFIGSTFIVVRSYHTPVAVKDKLRRD